MRTNSSPSRSWASPILSVEYRRWVARNRRSQSSMASQRSSIGERFQRVQCTQMTHKRPFSASNARRRPTGKSSITSLVPSDSLQNRQVASVTGGERGGARAAIAHADQLQRYYTLGARAATILVARSCSERWATQRCVTSRASARRTGDAAAGRSKGLVARAYLVAVRQIGSASCRERGGDFSGSSSKKKQ